MASSSGKGKSPAGFTGSCFKQPQWLLPSGGDEGELFRFVEVTAEEKILERLRSSAYKVKLVTSTSPSSSFSEPGGRIWLALIGQSGETALRCVDSGTRFQKGDVDVVEFLGPDLGKLEAIWIGPERGAWRLEEAVVTVAPGNEAASSRGVNYIFRGDGELLGDGGDVLAVELKPQVIESDPASSPRPNDDANTMKQYESLKRSLLVSHATLVALGAGVLALSSSRDVALAFSLGGALGLVYLLSLEGVVDRIGKGETTFRKPSVLVLLVAVIFFAAVIKGSVILQDRELSPGLLMGGVAGFLMYKVAVFMAATKKD
ncbi:hypothetical protein SELMODRAFT_424399 [Selaginella moellendorffii]|uniref:DUF7755 domain-containing protein n=1 Tax=Selaginella moellendorffii TaxID=88036 RepID=D8SPR9_SELML|nr:hypothetical protein SELMODRAFT_424399 [Selaginella moellendorffii]